MLYPLNRKNKPDRMSQLMSYYILVPTLSLSFFAGLLLIDNNVPLNSRKNLL